MNDWIHFFGKIKFVSNTTEIREHNSSHHSCQAGLKIEEIIIQALFWWFYYWTGFNFIEICIEYFIFIIDKMTNGLMMSIGASQPTLGSRCSLWGRSNARSGSAASLPDAGLSWSFTTSSSQWLLLMIDIFTIVPFHPTPQLYTILDGDGCKIVFCSSLSVGGLQLAHNDIFLGVFLDYMNPPSWPRASCHRGFLASRS